MSLRLDPRRLAALKLLASESGVRPGELVTRWVEERIDAARAGETGPSAVPAAALAELNERLDAMARRLAALEAGSGTPVPSEPAAAPEKAARGMVRRGRPPGRTGAPRKRAPAQSGGGSRIALHDEIIAIIGERGPMRAGELAAAVVERGRYAPPRSARPIDAAIINSRVSNPVYRDRFVRREGRIGLAEE